MAKRKDNSRAPERTRPSHRIIGPDVTGWQVVALDYDGKIVSQASAESLELLKVKLDGMLPQGGQSP